MKYYYSDPETGTQIEVSKETLEAIRKAWYSAESLGRSGQEAIKGRIMVFGTAGDLGKEDFKQLWDNPEGYGHKKW